MSYFIIGKQIQKFRKAAGLTQKELSEAIGISGSAVSQWESGGTPDISLLPVIADRLGVTTDALFGRENVAPENMAETLSRYVASLPEKKRVAEICSLMWEAVRSGCIGSNVPVGNASYAYRIYFASEEGILVGTATGEMPFMLVFPEPEKGYEACFASDETYRRFFAVLAKPHALALLKLLYRCPPKHYTSGVLAKRLEAAPEETEALLSEFAALRLVQKLDLETEDGNTDAYMVNDLGALVPFLYAAGLMIAETENDGGFHLTCDYRKTPLLKTPAPDQERGASSCSDT